MFSDLSEKERSSRTCVPLFCCVGFPLYRNQTLLKGIIILKFIRTSEYASHLLIHFICAYVSCVLICILSGHAKLYLYVRTLICESKCSKTSLLERSQLTGCIK